jgi:hypothetical protein
MPNRELEAEVYCPSCKHLYGTIFRVQVNQGHWAHETHPGTIPKYCGICECPTERKSHGR